MVFGRFSGDFRGIEVNKFTQTLLIFRAYFSHLLHAVSTRSALFEKQNALISIKLLNNMPFRGSVALQMP